jgi:hypothetical protein
MGVIDFLLVATLAIMGAILGFEDIVMELVLFKIIAFIVIFTFIVIASIR